MGHKKPRTVLVGLGAAVGAFGAAAMMSAATAPTARADDFTDIIANVETDLAAGQSDFGFAETAFASNQVVSGTAELLSGADDDFVAAPDSVLLGTVEALTNEPVTGVDPDLVLPPANFADALTDVQSEFAVAQTLSSEAVTALAGGDYGNAVGDELESSLFAAVFPAETLLLGELEALGL
jgi:hypothetical protein